MKENHFYSIDLLRGTVALLVCMYHLSEGFLTEGDWVRIVFSRGYLGVEIFFVISGFVIPYTMWTRNHQYLDTPRFLIKRLIRIEPPYWMSIVLIFVIDYLSKFFVHYVDKPIVIEPMNLFYHVLHLNDILGLPWLKGIYWSLAVEVQYYLFIALIFPFIFSHNPKTRYAFLFLFCLGRWLNIDHSVFYYGCHFVSGILFFQLTAGLISKKEFVISLAFFWGITLWCFDIYHLSAVIFSVLVMYYAQYNFKPMVFMGKISYSFYLIHIQVAWVLMDAYVRSYPNGNKYEQMFLCILTAVIASTVFYYLFEKPSHALAKKI